jgi:hypothetical protein
LIGTKVSHSRANTLLLRPTFALIFFVKIYFYYVLILAIYCAISPGLSLAVQAHYFLASPFEEGGLRGICFLIEKRNDPITRYQLIDD